MRSAAAFSAHSRILLSVASRTTSRWGTVFTTSATRLIDLNHGVRFTARALSGPDAPERDSVCIDLWDDYLDPA